MPRLEWKVGRAVSDTNLPFICRVSGRPSVRPSEHFVKRSDRVAEEGRKIMKVDNFDEATLAKHVYCLLHWYAYCLLHLVQVQLDHHTDVYCTERALKTQCVICLSVRLISSSAAPRNHISAIRDVRSVPPDSKHSSVHSYTHTVFA